MRLKELYRRFRAWQEEPFHYENAEEQHTCVNCGQAYEGDFCPICGLKTHLVQSATIIQIYGKKKNANRFITNQLAFLSSRLHR